MDVIFTRTSVRAYTAQPVEPEKLELLLRAGMAAPSACNQQPWEFYVTAEKTRLEALSGVRVWERGKAKNLPGLPAGEVLKKGAPRPGCQGAP